jgi:hypothetical protein
LLKRSSKIKQTTILLKNVTIGFAAIKFILVLLPNIYWMNPNTPPGYRNNSEDEIDLGKLFEKIGNFFLNLILIFFRNIKALISIVAVTVILGLAFYFIQKPVFMSELTLSSRFLTTDFCQSLIEDLNKFVEEENYSQLNHSLKLEKGQAEEIEKLKFSYLIDDDKLEETPDSILKHAPFKVIASVNDNTILDSLGERIKNYIQNNKFAKKREMIEKENIRNEINLLVTQRKSLDTLKRLVAQNLTPRGSKDALIYGEPYDPLNVYREEISFYNRELGLRRVLIESESVEIIHDFTKFKKPRKAIGLIKCVFFAGLIGALLGLVYIIIKEIGVALKKYELKKADSITS